MSGRTSSSVELTASLVAAPGGSPVVDSNEMLEFTGGRQSIPFHAFTNLESGGQSTEWRAVLREPARHLSVTRAAPIGTDIVLDMSEAVFSANQGR